MLASVRTLKFYLNSIFWIILSGCLQIFIHSIHLFLSIHFAHISNWDQINAISLRGETYV